VRALHPHNEACQFQFKANLSIKALKHLLIKAAFSLHASSSLFFCLLNDFVFKLGLFGRKIMFENGKEYVFVKNSNKEMSVKITFMLGIEID
jgi:hypothetical protein